MAFTTNCTSKGCHKFQEPYLDPATMKVHCSECDKEILNLSIFTINQMKSSKQFKKAEKVPFAVKCNKCNVTKRPVVDTKGEVVCCNCKKPLDNVSSHFKEMLKEKLKTADKDV